jgi:allophanate hydrolase
VLIFDLLNGYRAGRFTPVEVMERVLASIDAAPERHVWITRLARDTVFEQARALAARGNTDLPLYGVPFAIKDNIDLAGIPTTAACAEFAYVPAHSASVVRKLIDAGAIPVGKTNLDQFATGLVGTRSPYGTCRNAIDGSYISGGSSSGSAVAVASGLVSFALGTDTAGSGRVPAAFNNIVGLKPSCGLVSTAGIVPACRSLDCVSIFALTAADAGRVLDVVCGFDADDPYSRRLALRTATGGLQRTVRAGFPVLEGLEFFGDLEYARLFADARQRAAGLGWSVVDVDIAPLLEAARLLYEGPWLAERYLAIESLLRSQPSAIHEVTRAIVMQAEGKTAIDAFRAHHRLSALRRVAEPIWEKVDVLVLPTAGTIYSLESVLRDPLRLNANLGHYTNFVNLMDLAAVAVPAGFRADGLPFGVSLIAPAGSDRQLLGFGAALHATAQVQLGALDLQMPEPERNADEIAAGHVTVVVCGAHMSELPLNHQLREREGYCVRCARTAAAYRFYALPGGPPKRPGLVRVADSGAHIDVELWALPAEHFGSFVNGIPAPLAIGKVQLEDGSWHSGFICETYGVAGAQDITAFGGWRAFLAR